MPLPPCERCGEESTGWVRLDGIPVWMCPKHVDYEERRWLKTFGEPTKGDLFAPEDQ